MHSAHARACWRADALGSKVAQVLGLAVHILQTHSASAAIYKTACPESHGDKTKEAVFHQSCMLKTLWSRSVSCHIT